MTNWNRERLLLKTLESFRHSKSKDFNVIIVDNKSDKDSEIPPLPYEVRIVKLTSGLHYMAAHNYGFHYAIQNMKPDIILMQHSECYHQGDVISYAKTVTEQTYISFACYSLGQGEEPETVEIKNRCMTSDGESAWYNHPVYRPRYTHFCAAITTKNLIKLNGFDERFCEGVWFEDDYFLEQIKRLGLKIELCVDPFIFHQWHEIVWRDSDKIFRNRDLYNELKNGTDYRALHTLTPDL
jgi:GT2 family glycosyltransferase